MYYLIIFQNLSNDDLIIRCANDFRKYCYSILIDIIIDYFEQIILIKIKQNIQCFIYHVSSQKRENLNKN